MNHRQKTSLILALLCFAVAAFIAVMAGAQNVEDERMLTITPMGDFSVPLTQFAAPVPLTCPKYQHEEKTPGYCAPTCDSNDLMCTSLCQWVAPTDRCRDDTHTVTEREWQELQARIAELERELKAAKADRRAR